MLTVMKFGGSSVADLAHIRNVAQRCIEKQQAGSQVVVVLSAMGKTENCQPADNPPQAASAPQPAASPITKR